MSHELRELLSLMLDICEMTAARVPTPLLPPSAAEEQATDEWLQTYFASRDFSPPPIVAACLIPRLHAAYQLGSALELSLSHPAAMAEPGEYDTKLARALLVTLWHQIGRSRWLAGRL